MSQSCLDTHMYISGCKVRSGVACVTVDGKEKRIITGRRQTGIGTIHVKELQAAGGTYVVSIEGADGSMLSLPFDPACAHGHRGRAQFNPEQLSDEDDQRTYVATTLAALPEYAHESIDYTDAVLAAAVGHATRAGGLDENKDGILVKALVRRVIDRGGQNANYYTSLDHQHFGADATASNFTEHQNADEALAACAYQRGGLHGDDRNRLIALGTDPDALLGPEACRYLVFDAAGLNGICPVGELPVDAVVTLVQEKPGIPLSVVLAGRRSDNSAYREAREPVAHATAIIGADGALWTVHPGLPAVRRETLSFEEAGFKAGDSFTVGALVLESSGEGRALRERFTQAGVGFPGINHVKVPSRYTGRQPLPEGFRRTNFAGYAVSDQDDLLERLAASGVKAKFDKLIAHHITETYPSKAPAPDVSSIVAYGIAERDGVQALLVTVDGRDKRHDGSAYHITLSIDDGHKPAEGGHVASDAVDGLLDIEEIAPFELGFAAF